MIQFDLPEVAPLKLLEDLTNASRWVKTTMAQFERRTLTRSRFTYFASAGQPTILKGSPRTKFPCVSSGSHYHRKATIEYAWCIPGEVPVAPFGAFVYRVLSSDNFSVVESALFAVTFATSSVM